MELVSVIIGIQQKASANCLNDITMVQDSDGTTIASTPVNAAPSQELELELEFGDEVGSTMSSVGLYRILGTLA